MRAAEVAVDDQIAAIKSETAERVQGWLQRTQRWRMQASALMSKEVAAGRARITERQSGVDEETALARQMEPSRTLLRPLLVVVPQDFEGEN